MTSLVALILEILLGLMLLAFIVAWLFDRFS